MGPRRSALLVLAVLSALALCCAAPALALEPAGDGWYWQLPQPQGQVLRSVDVSGEKDAWAVGDCGAILHSVDGGASWTSQTSPTTDPLTAVAFADGAHGCAVGGYGADDFVPGGGFMTSVIAVTDDGGATWRLASQPARFALADVTFADSRAGWAVGRNGTILHTTDAGATWLPQRSGVQSMTLTAVTFADALHGYIVGQGGVFLTTRDGGLTWTRQSAMRNIFAFWPTALVMDDAGTLWMGMGMPGGAGPENLARSADGGRHWRAVDAGYTYAITGLATSGTHLYAVGPAGDDSDLIGTSRIFESDDRGATWSSHVVGQDIELLDVVAKGAAGPCAVGAGTVSTDAGASWSGTGFYPRSVGSLDFVSPTDGWATGTGALGLLGLIQMLGDPVQGSILHTADGVTWQQQLSDTRHYYADIDFADARSGWAVGTVGAIRRSDDGGATWRAQALGTRTAFTQVEAPSANDAWVMGYALASGDSVILRTADAGKTWAPVDVPGVSLPMAMSFLSGTEGWVGGYGRSGPRVLHTVDGGATWAVSALPTESGLLLPVAMDFIDPDHGWVAAWTADGRGESSRVFATSDGGETWTPTGARGDFNNLVTAVDFVDAQHGWVAGEGVWSTSDGGATWKREVARLGYLTGVGAADATHVYAGAEGWGIVSTVDASGDTAPPVTLSEGARGWLRRATSISLAARDVGGSGVAGTEYRLDAGAWTPYSAPLSFPAPADHSGDGRHLIEYRSTDGSGLVEPVQVCRVNVDTVRPVVHLSPSKIGRDGVFRLRGRIDDSSCAAIDQFSIVVRTRRGRRVTGGGYVGFRWPTNRPYTFREPHSRFWAPDPGVYRIELYATDPAGNRQSLVGRSRFVVKYRPKQRTAEQLSTRGWQVTSRARSAADEATTVDIRTVLERLPQRLRTMAAEFAEQVDQQR